MTYTEMKQAEAEFQNAIDAKPAKKQRGATKAQLVYRAERFLKVVAAAVAAEAKLAAIARTRRPTEAETAEALRAYRAAERAA